MDSIEIGLKLVITNEIETVLNRVSNSVSTFLIVIRVSGNFLLNTLQSGDKREIHINIRCRLSLQKCKMEKKRGSNWTEAERHAALSTIISHHDELFSKFKGATFGHKSKEAKWTFVLNEINS